MLYKKVVPFTEGMKDIVRWNGGGDLKEGEVSEISGHEPLTSFDKGDFACLGCECLRQVAQTETLTASSQVPPGVISDQGHKGCRTF